MYLLFTTFTDVFEGEYGFTTSTSGLVYLGLGVALVICMLLFGALNERVQAACLKADGATQPRPEYRLVLMIFFSPLVGVGLFIYGWTVQYRVHWIVPIIGTMVMGFGAFFVLVSFTSAINPSWSLSTLTNPTRCLPSYTWSTCLALRLPLQLLEPIILCVICQVRFCH